MGCASRYFNKALANIMFSRTGLPRSATTSAGLDWGRRMFMWYLAQPSMKLLEEEEASKRQHQHQQSHSTLGQAPSPLNQSCLPWQLVLHARNESFLSEAAQQHLHQQQHDSPGIAGVPVLRSNPHGQWLSEHRPNMHIWLSRTSSDPRFQPFMLYMRHMCVIPQLSEQLSCSGVQECEDVKMTLEHLQQHLLPSIQDMPETSLLTQEVRDSKYESAHKHTGVDSLQCGPVLLSSQTSEVSHSTGQNSRFEPASMHLLPSIHATPDAAQVTEASSVSKHEGEHRHATVDLLQRPRVPLLHQISGISHSNELNSRSRLEYERRHMHVNHHHLPVMRYISGTPHPAEQETSSELSSAQQAKLLEHQLVPYARHNLGTASSIDQMNSFKQPSAEKLVFFVRKSTQLGPYIRHMSCTPDSMKQNSSGEQKLAQKSAVLERLPPQLVPYVQLMRLDKPIGTWLLLWPGYWSIALAAAPGSLPDLELLAYFGVGAVLLRGAGCTINDMWDADFDRRVARTKNRPLAAGTLTYMQATGALAVQLSLGLVILLQLNTLSQIVGASSLLLVGTYPLMKRVTSWPQAYLGLVFNWGALMGWTAATNTLPGPAPLLLYASGITWTLIYDTIYAHQDASDDKQIGVRSTALLFGERTKTVLRGFACLNAALLVAAGFEGGLGPYYMVGAAACAAHAGWQLGTVNLKDPADCAAKFRSNKWYGGMLFLAIAADRLMGNA